MAQVWAGGGYDITDINWAFVLGLSSEVEFLDDAGLVIEANPPFGPTKLSDAVFGILPTDDNWGLLMAGRGFAFDELTRTLTAGTVQAIAVGALDSRDPGESPIVDSSSCIARGLSIDARDAFAAALTVGRADDVAVLAKAFAGDDTFTLSGWSHTAWGFAGNDRITVAADDGGSCALHGGDGADRIEGGAGADRLWGDAGNDVLRGGEWADAIWAGTGRDRLIGGGGQDRLIGGTDAAADVFVFTAASDSDPSAPDVILHFTRAASGGDRIDLSGIDAQPGGADDAFAWGGQAARAHGVWWSAQGGDVILHGDVTGDRVADFAIRLDHLAGLGSGDLVL